MGSIESSQAQSVFAIKESRVSNKLTGFVLLLLVLSSPLFAEEKKSGVCVPEGKWITNKGNSHSIDAIIHSLSKTKVVLLGEDHDNPEHHRWQLQTMSAIYAQEPGMVLGFEAFPRATQKYLDQWVAGDLTEEDFLESVDWDKIWRFNKDYYMPMFHFARMNRIPMYALNVDRELVSKVGDKGWDNVPESEREGVSKPAEPSRDYIEVLAEVFAQHMPKHAHAEEGEASELTESEINEILEKASFQRFLQGQLLWDRAMAEIFHQSIKEKNHPMIVGVLGAGHIMGNYGVPHQLNAMGIKNIKTLMPWDGTIECQQLLDGAIDIAYGIVEISRKTLEAEEERPRLGVYLEHNDGVEITRLVEKSVAEKTGIKQGDKVVQIAGKPVEKVSDVVAAVKSTAFGTWLPIVVMREDKEIELVAKFPAK